MESYGGSVIIHPKFDKLITSMRFALENAEASLDKDATSYGDLFTHLGCFCSSGIDQKKVDKNLYVGKGSGESVIGADLS
jgi:hypothetical protein